MVGIRTTKTSKSTSKIPKGRYYLLVLEESRNYSKKLYNDITKIEVKQMGIQCRNK